MPRPIKDGNNFEINRSIVYNGKDINFHMPSMSACIKHYEIGFQISGSHHVYSTDGEWDILRGYVGTMPLGLHHQTFYTSNETHNSILIKYSFDMTDINVDNICKLFSFSSSHFSRLFKQNTGEAFSRYLSKVRLEHAIVLLSNTDKPIDQIAYECGFKSTSYFSYAFKKEFLVSPLKYRMQMKG